MSIRPIKPSKAARNRRKQHERKLAQVPARTQQALEKALEQAKQALEQAKLMGQYSQQLAAGAMSALNVSKG